MNTRRGFLATLGSVAFAGCSSSGDAATQNSTTGTQTTQTTKQTTTEEGTSSKTTENGLSEEQRALLRQNPLYSMREGEEIGEYEHWMLESDTSGMPVQRITSLLNGDLPAQRKAEDLGKILNNYGSKNYSGVSEIGAAGTKAIAEARQQADTDHNFIINVNKFYGGNTREFLDIAPLEEDGDTYSMQPVVIADPETGVVNTSNNDSVEMYNAIRSSRNQNAMVSQDAVGEHMVTKEQRNESDTDEERLRRGLKIAHKDHSYALLGDNEEEKFLLADVPTANSWFEAAYIADKDSEFDSSTRFDRFVGPTLAYTGQHQENDKWTRADHKGKGNYKLKEGLGSFKLGDTLPKDINF